MVRHSVGSFLISLIPMTVRTRTRIRSRVRFSIRLGLVSVNESELGVRFLLNLMVGVGEM